MPSSRSPAREGDDLRGYVGAQLLLAGAALNEDSGPVDIESDGCFRFARRADFSLRSLFNVQWENAKYCSNRFV